MLGSDMLSKISRHPGSIWLQFSCILSIEWCSISTSFYSTIWDIDALFVCHYNSTHPLCKSAAFTHAGMVQHFLLHKPKKHIEPFQQVRLGFFILFVVRLSVKWRHVCLDCHGNVFYRYDTFCSRNTVLQCDSPSSNVLCNSVIPRRVYIWIICTQLSQSVPNVLG